MNEFKVRHEGAEKALREIGTLVKDALPEGYGFNLMIFSYGDGGDMFYMSSAKREDMVKAMKEFIEKAESGEV